MKTDVLIIGGGPGGSAAAMFLLREGITPLIIEQEEFPRFHIGESLTGESAQVLRRLGLEDLGPILSCGRDGAMIEGFNPAIDFRRTQTLMEGAAYCDFRYQEKAGFTTEAQRPQSSPEPGEDRDVLISDLALLCVRSVLSVSLW